MPPSVRYSYTISAFCSPECGRESGAFSTWTSAGARRPGVGVAAGFGAGLAQAATASKVMTTASARRADITPRL